MAGSFHWELKLLGLKVGTKELETHETPLILMDTGTSISYLPTRDYNRFLAEVCEDIDCYQSF